MDIFWLCVFGVSLAGGQLLFKQAALAIVGRSGPQMMTGLLTSPAFWAAILLYGAATLLWIWLLTRIPLSRAYPFSAIGFVLVPACAALVFGERPSPSFWLGAALVAVGIVLTQRSTL